MTDTWHMTVHEMMRTRWKKHEKQPHVHVAVHVAAYSIQGRNFSQSRLLPDASRQHWISFGRNELNFKNNCFVIITLDQYYTIFSCAFDMVCFLKPITISDISV